MKKNAWLVMVVVLVISMAVCIGCSGEGREEANFEAVNSEAVSENAADITSSEEVSEAVSEEVSEEVVSEEAAEEEPVIVNVILTREEADAYIEDLKVKYPEMSEEEIVALFINFNIHSLDADTIAYYTSNYECVEFCNIVSRKLKTIATTGMPDEKEYAATWNLADFITNDKLKKFAQEIEDYMTEYAYTMNEDKYYSCQESINDYMYGTNNIGFTFDYNSHQRESTDLDAICYFMAYHNFIYNKDNIGFSDFVSQEVLYTPVEKYQMELNGEE